MVLKAMAGIFIFAIACGVGFGVASADSSDDVAQSGALGFDKATQLATSAGHTQRADADASSQESYYEQSTLTSASLRTIDSGISMIDEKEKLDRQNLAADNVAAPKRAEKNRAKQGNCDYGMSEVDWSVGRDAFVAEWGSRINAYLSGSELAGYGEVFARAAWDNGVDPRWSPAISDTESSKGKVCFLPHNAWGWGESSWDDWETAIKEHVAGLAKVYGYSVTPTAAAVYCPPNHVFWYGHTYEQMTWI
jgi:hypothetical protein